MADNESIDIRQARIDDLAPIFHLGEQVFTSQGYSNLYRTWDEYEVTTLFNVEPDYLFVATDEDQVVGFAMGTTIEKARSAWKYGYLVWMGVEPEYRRRGVASRLFERFREQMVETGVRMLLVDTQADNKPALEFFVEKGFENPIEHVYMTMQLQKDDGEDG